MGPVSLACFVLFVSFSSAHQNLNKISLTVPTPKLSSDFQLFSLWLVFPATVLVLRLLPLHMPGLLVQQTQRLTAQIPS